MNETTARGERFTLIGWTPDESTAAVHFDYDCARFGAFRETVSWPSVNGPITDALDDGLAGLLDLLMIALGISYYKCAAAPRLTANLVYGSDSARAMMEALYTEGLAEFYVRAGLPWPADVTIDIAERERPASEPVFVPRKTGHALIAFGGGKDSYVAERIVSKAGLDWTAVSSVMSDKVADTIQRASVTPVTFMRRRLDPKLREVNAQGAFNGHVPITAINSLMLVILGRLTGAAHAIFANERSADEPTMSVDGISANHQYSKSSFFEEKLRAAIGEADDHAPEYFSILRPWSEIWIARAFAGMDDPKAVFTSCNRNFQIAGDIPPRWCGDCAKCAFTSLLLAPHMTRDEAASIFPDIFPDKERLLPVYRELLGLTDTKPWDCVGTINECRATLWRMSQMIEWQNCRVVQTFMPEILALHSEEDLSAFWEEGLSPHGRHFVPDIFMEAAHAL